MTRISLPTPGSTKYFNPLCNRSTKDIEYYSEYWETNRFPGERQALLLRDYLRQKYTGRKIDALVAPASIPLDFLLKYRSELFPDASIVFATERPVDQKLMAASNATGVVYANSYRRTIDLALKLHPGTEQVFIISGSPVEGNGGSPADVSLSKQSHAMSSRISKPRSRSII